MRARLLVPDTKRAFDTRYTSTMTSMFTLLGEKRVRSTTPPPGDAAIAVDGALSGPIQEALKNILPTHNY
eukprot:jgi/Botrbrau1/13366/Bobra.0158s0019.1